MIELIYIARRDALTSVEYLGSIWRPLGRTAADCAFTTASTTNLGYNAPPTTTSKKRR